MNILICYVKRHAFAIVVILLVSLLGSCVDTGGTSDAFYGITRGSPPHAFVIDISGSMGIGTGDTARSGITQEAIKQVDKATKQVNTGIAAVDGLLKGLQNDVMKSARAQTTKLAEARRQLIPFIRGLPEGSRFSVTAFNSRYQRFGAGGVPATPSSREGAIAFVNAFDARGGTSLRPPLEEVFRERPATIYLVSDGKPSESDNTILEMAQIARRNGSVIHTIGVGEDQNQGLLQQVAQITGGTYSPQGTSIPLGLLPK